MIKRNSNLPKKILVTGTAGFIGYHLAKKLLERGDEVVGIDNINDYYDVNLKYGRLKELGISREDIKSNNSKFNILNTIHKLKSDLKETLDAIERLVKQ